LIADRSWEPKLLDLRSGSILRQFRGHQSQVDAIALSSDGQRVLSGGHDGVLKLWDATSGRELGTLSGHRGTIECVAFSPDDRTALSGGRDRQVILWDLQTGKAIRAFHGHTNMGFAVDGNIGRSGDGYWDLRSGRRVFAESSRSHRMELRDWSPVLRVQGFERGLAQARETLDRNPNDPAALATFGEWWAFRGFDEWAVEFIERAREQRGDVSPLVMARCYWKLDKLTEARREFEKAIARKEAPEPYLRLCLYSVANEQESLSSRFWIGTIGGDRPEPSAWRKVDELNWEERYLDGRINTFQFVAPWDRDGRKSIVVRRADGMEILIPPLEEGQQLAWRQGSQDSWHEFAQIHPGPMLPSTRPASSRPSTQPTGF